MKSIINTVITFVVLSAVIAACKKSVDPQPDSVATGLLYFHLHTVVDDSIEINDYNLVNGDTSLGQRRILVSKAQLYLSNIELVKSDGSLLSIPDTIILKKIDKEIYALTNAPAGQYQSVRFHVGLSSEVNSKVPDASSASVLRDSSMWFTQTAASDNYVFVNFQGKIDTTLSGKGKDSDMVPFEYKIGTDANYKQVIMPVEMFSVLPDQVQYIHINVDYTKLFNGIKLNDQSNLSVTSSADNATVIGASIANNIPDMFSYEQ